MKRSNGLIVERRRVLCQGEADNLHVIYLLHLLFCGGINNQIQGEAVAAAWPLSDGGIFLFFFFGLFTPSLIPLLEEKPVQQQDNNNNKYDVVFNYTSWLIDDLISAAAVY